MLRNDGGNRGGFLNVDLEGRTSNRSAIGAIVTVKAGDLLQRAERRAGAGYLSHDDWRLHVGLGDRSSVDWVEIRWPRGAVQRFSGIAANTFLRVVEGAPAPEIVVTPTRESGR